MLRKIIFLLFFSAALPLCINAKEAKTTSLKLSSLFTDHMVLQRGDKLPVWGWAKSGKKITVSLNGKSAAGKTGKDGKWIVWLPAMDAGGPYELEVKADKKITVKDVLIGDVWICGGQSNMEFMLAKSLDSRQEIQSANNQPLRLLKVERATSMKPKDNFNGKWTTCTPANIKTWSAVGYYFAKHINETHKVPVGLISSNWGGTNIEPWTNLEALSKLPEAANTVQQYKELLSRFPNGDPTIKKGKKVKKISKYASSMYNGMIAPLIPYPVKGVIWYQGESNAKNAYDYRVLFPALIKGWRAKWNREFPFLWVQLANFRDAKTEPVAGRWAVIRESQNMALKLPKTATALAIDIGNPKDIHPRNKKDVGYRLSLGARKIAYGEDIVFSGPTYKSMKVDGNKIHIKFDHTGGGLVAKGGELKRFAIAGKDQKFYWGKAVIEGDEVVVSADEVKKPVAVRYAFETNPEGANLYNKEGLPASPFRSDTWKVLTQN